MHTSSPIPLTLTHIIPLPWVHYSSSLPLHDQYEVQLISNDPGRNRVHTYTHTYIYNTYKQCLFLPPFPPSHPLPKKENQRICAHQGLMGTVTDGANDMCPSRGSTLVLARLVTYAQSQGQQRSTQPPVSGRDTPVTPLLRRHNDRDRP